MFEAVGAVIAAVIKAGVPIYVAALIASTLLLFLPDSIAHRIGVAEFRQLYRGYLGGAFVASISLLAAYGLSATFHAIGNRLDDRRVRRVTLKTLRTLTSDEKRFLRTFIFDDRNTVRAAISDGRFGRSRRETHHLSVVVSRNSFLNPASQKRYGRLSLERAVHAE